MQPQSDNRRWIHTLQRSDQPKVAPERAMHYGVAEASAKVLVQTLPADFGERLHEHKVLSTPGLNEGLEQTDRAIEDWEQSL